MKGQFISFIKAAIKGVGQIMLQGNIWTGLLFIIATFYGSTTMGIAALVSNIVGTLTAKLLKYEDNDIDFGLYGFNATLVGIALVFYYHQNIWVWVAVIIGSILSTIFMNWGVKKKIPLFTFPFIAITWILLYVLGSTGLAEHASPEHFVDLDGLEDLGVEGHAFGEVMFQGSIASGIIFFIGVFVSSPISALYGLFSIVLSVFISRRLHETPELVNDGLLSFNAVLCGIALAGPRVKDGVYVLIAVFISTVVDHMMIHSGLITLTFPFVFGTWIVVLLKKAEEKFFPAGQTLS